MKVKEFKEIISKYPDDADIVIWAFRDCDIKRLDLDIDKKWMRYDSRTNLASIDAMIRCNHLPWEKVKENIRVF